MVQAPKQIIPIPELNSDAGTAEMEISTEKYHTGHIVSVAHIYFKKDGMITFELCGDFRKVLLRKRGTATQRNLDAQHFSVFTPEVLDALKAEALTFYAAKRKK